MYNTTINDDKSTKKQWLNHYEGVSGKSTCRMIKKGSYQGIGSSGSLGVILQSLPAHFTPASK